MCVVEAFMAFNANRCDMKSTSLSGWEYLIVWKDLGLSPMYAICVLFDWLLILINCMVMLGTNIII